MFSSQDNHGKLYLYVLGGWNKEYTSEVHRIEVDAAGAFVGTAWEQFTAMKEARSDQVRKAKKNCKYDPKLI